jgi:hypothetical protein
VTTPILTTAPVDSTSGYGPSITAASPIAAAAALALYRMVRLFTVGPELIADPADELLAAPELDADLINRQTAIQKLDRQPLLLAHERTCPGARRSRHDCGQHILAHAVCLVLEGAQRRNEEVALLTRSVRRESAAQDL